MDLSFSGAGFMGCYYFGVVNCWNKYIPRERVRRVAGASAGSLIAAYYLMDLPLDSCLKEIVGMTEEARSRALGVFDRSNQIVDTLPKLLDKLFPPDAHKRVNGRLYVAMTRLKDMKCVIVNQFDSRKDLIDALNCSCFIPVWSGNHVATYKGVKHIDGGFTNNLPVFDEHTIRICCFSGRSDISPVDRDALVEGNAMGMPFKLNWKNLKRGGRALWPPPPSYIVGLLERGFHDAKDFILSNDLIQCDHCFNSTQPELRPIYSAITPTISPAASPGVSRANSSLDLSEPRQRTSSFRRIFGAKKVQDKEESRHGAGAKRVHMKAHRQQPVGLSALFEQDRSKSGKQIKHKCLLRSQSEVGKEKERQGSQVGFATKLREKLQQVATSRAPASAGQQQRLEGSKEELAAESRQMAVQSPMPSIVIEEPQLEDEGALEEDRRALAAEDAESDRQIVTIMDIMKSQAEEQAREERDKGGLGAQKLTPQKKTKRQQRTVSESSSETSSSNDSAVGLDAPSPTGNEGGVPVAGSPAEKFFASSPASQQHRRAASLSSVAPLDGAQQARLQQLAASAMASGDSAGVASANQLSALMMPDRFASAPSPLPSCPPSPNLNRHCTECIRLRQQARMDAIDALLKQEVALYGSMKSKDPEREFNSLRFKLTAWLRQFGTTKYTYSFECDDEDGAQQQQQQKQPRRQSADCGQLSAAKSSPRAKTRALRRGSLAMTLTPPSEIPLN